MRPEEVVAPTVAIYEVYKWIKRERSEDEALAAVATMKKTVVADLTEEVALVAADLSLLHGLAMADAMMLAFAQVNGAELVTTDSDFAGVAGVTIFPKKRK
jgi:predicted nucleic acid-binding protein